MNQENTQIDNVLKQTEVGSLYLKHKNLLIGLVVLALLSVFVWGTYSHYAAKNAAKAQTLSHEFTQNELRAYAEKKISAQDLAKNFEELIKKSSSRVELLPLAIKISDVLLAEKNVNEAITILEKSKESFGSENAYASFFILSRLAVAYEDAGKTKEAIEIVEALNKSSLKISEGKNYLDLGRLYMKLGDKEKARANLEYVVEKLPAGDFTRVARIYLAQLGSQK